MFARCLGVFLASSALALTGFQVLTLSDPAASSFEATDSAKQAAVMPSGESRLTAARVATVTAGSPAANVEPARNAPRAFEAIVVRSILDEQLTGRLTITNDPPGDATGSQWSRPVSSAGEAGEVSVPTTNEAVALRTLVALRDTGEPLNQIDETAPARSPGTLLPPAVGQVPALPLQPRMTHPAMHVGNYGLLQYRRMMKFNRAPHPHELLGSWRGINKGVATVAIDQQFIKRFYLHHGQVYGDNVTVHQVPHHQLATRGWCPVLDSRTGQPFTQGRFRVECPQGIGHFRHGLVLNYRAGGNPHRDPSRVIWDQLVKLDDNHMLGRATVRAGLAKIPVAFFVLERIEE
jgi:hypothetical protein